MISNSENIKPKAILATHPLDYTKQELPSHMGKKARKTSP